METPKIPFFLPSCFEKDEAKQLVEKEQIRVFQVFCLSPAESESTLLTCISPLLLTPVEPTFFLCFLRRRTWKTRWNR